MGGNQSIENRQNKVLSSIGDIIKNLSSIENIINNLSAIEDIISKEINIVNGFMTNLNMKITI